MNWFFKRVPTREIQLQVEELHCEMCAQTVREALQKVAAGLFHSLVKRGKLKQKRLKLYICSHSFKNHG